MVKDMHSAPACLGLNLGSATSLGLGLPLLKVGGGEGCLISQEPCNDQMR